MTSSAKRQRHKEGHRSRVEAAHAQRAQAQRRRLTVTLLVILGLVVAAAVAVRALTDDDAADAGAAQTTSTSTTDPEVTHVSLPTAPEGRTIEGPTPCPTAEETERVAQFSEAPPMCITAGEPLEAVVETTAGTFSIALDTEAAPIAANNFVVLARYRYFDGLPFHRLLPDLYAQTGSSGDPTWPAGGPGYDLVGGEPPTGAYAAGDVAMAKGESAVSGSQWFVVISDAGAQNLDPDPTYPRLGRITDGLDVATALAAKGDPAQTSDGTDGNPTELVTVSSVTIRTPTD